MKMSRDDVISIKLGQIANCARCGDAHDGLEAVRFTRIPTEMYDTDGDGPYNHWTTCPNTTEPILVFLTE